MTHLVRGRLVGTAASVLLAATLAGCGGDGQPAADSPSPAPATTTAQSAGRQADRTAGVPARSRQRSSEPGQVAAAGDLANFRCEQRRGLWTARGDVSNPTKQPMVYTVTVVTVAGADVAGDDSERFVLRPGQSTSFRFPGISQGPADTCMPRLVRAPR